MTEQWNQPQTDAADTAPEGVDNFSEVSSEPRKPRISGPTLILFAAFASALAILYLLGMQNRPRAATAADLAKEQRDKQLLIDFGPNNPDKLKALFMDTRNLASTLRSGTQHLAAPRLSHDPFGAEAEPAPNNVPIIPTNTDEAEKMRRVAELFKTLQLESVMIAGKNSAAMIKSAAINNQQMVQVGSAIGDLTVTAIEAHRVLLSYGGHTFELKQSGPGPVNQ